MECSRSRVLTSKLEKGAQERSSFGESRTLLTSQRLLQTSAFSVDEAQRSAAFFKASCAPHDCQSLWVYVRSVHLSAKLLEKCRTIKPCFRRSNGTSRVTRDTGNALFACFQA